MSGQSVVDELEGEPDLAEVLRAIDVLDPRRLAHFLAVANELSFHRAARKLFISQPALSQSIRKLEATLGFPLLDRTNTRVEVTPIGRYVFGRGAEMFEHLQETVAEVQKPEHQQDRPMRVAFAPACWISARAVIAEYARQYGGEAIDARQEQSQWIVDDVASGRVDLGIVLMTDEIPGVASMPFRNLPLVCAMGAEHPLADHTDVSIGQVREFPLTLIQSPKVTPWRTMLVDIVGADGYTPRFLHLQDLFYDLPQAMLDAHGIWPMTSEYPLTTGLRKPLMTDERVEYRLIWKQATANESISAFFETLGEVANASDWN